MEVNAAHTEEREIREMDDLLPSLHKRGLLTDIECRIIICVSQLSEKQLTLYRIMMTKNKQKAAQLVERLRVMTCRLHAKEKLKLQESDYKHSKNELDSPFETNKNPMFNNTVIKCIFGFLPLDDIQSCRMVSRQWNSQAEILLRKRAKIHFRTDGLRPETFLAVSKFSLPDLPFSAFKFSEHKDAESYWRVPELEEFFEKWGGNIEELYLDNINLQDPSNLALIDRFDVTPWLKKASKITSLKMEGSEVDEEELDMSLWVGELKNLSAIKTLILIGSSIETCSKKNITRIVPINVELSNIICKRDDEILDQFRYNDVFDFCQAIAIRLNNSENRISEATFDMREHVFKNTDVLCLNQISVTNWKEAKGSVRHVELREIPFTEKNQLKIQSLKISQSAIDLFALPRTVERIEVNNCYISCSQPCSLPNLKFLHLDWDENYQSEFTQFQLDKCEDLKELVIFYYGEQETSVTRMFDVRSLPKNVQTLRIGGNLIKYITDDWILEVPGIVVLDASYGCRFSDYTRISKSLLTGTLVVVCYSYMQVNTTDIVQFLLVNMQKEHKRIFIGMMNEKDDLHSHTVFEGSLFSSIVDKKSNYYEFQNSCGIIGKAIARDHFWDGCISVGGESIPFFLEDE